MIFFIADSLEMMKWKKEDMEVAIKSCRTGIMGLNKASKTFNVPKSTLARYVSSGKPSAEVLGAKVGRKPIFPPVLEKSIAEHCKEMEKRFFGLTRSDVRRLAFWLSKVNGLPTPFSENDAMAGKKWLKLFLNRHKDLSVRKSEGLSLARGKGFNPLSVQQFFAIYETEFQRIGGNPSRIYNCDETGVTNVQHRMPDVST